MGFSCHLVMPIYKRQYLLPIPGRGHRSKNKTPSSGKAELSVGGGWHLGWWVLSKVTVVVYSLRDAVTLWNTTAWHNMPCRFPLHFSQLQIRLSNRKLVSGLPKEISLMLEIKIPNSLSHNCCITAFLYERPTKVSEEPTHVFQDYCREEE